jgi:hypothetical protein
VDARRLLRAPAFRNLAAPASRLLDRGPFRRHRLFALFGNLGLAILSVFLLLLVPAQLRVERESAALRLAWTNVPPLSQLSDERGRDLYARALRMSRTPSPQSPLIANLMREVHEAARTEPLSRFAGRTLLLACAAGFAVLPADLLLLASRK